MINYVYRARTVKNQLVTGHIQAASIQDAEKTLRENELVPVSVTQPKGIGEYIPFANRVSQKDKTVFARQLATMLDAGLTISQALRLLVRQTKRGPFQVILTGVLSDIQDGFSFSNALAKYPDVFDTIFINVIRSGEATGRLEVVLKEMSRNMEKDLSIRGKIVGALIYPAFILVVMLGVALVMAIVVIPNLKEVFAGAEKQLPASTLILLYLSDVIIHQWYWLILGVIVLIVAIRQFFRSDAGIEFYSSVSLKIPILGSIIEEGSMSRLSRLLGLLLNAGVPLLEALRLINDSFNNKLYQRGITKVAAEVERGVPMSTPIMNNPLFPTMVGQMVSVGEQTGKMDEVMNRLADYYENELENKVSALASLIEPFVIILLGVGVAWLVTAILLPIYQISSSI